MNTLGVRKLFYFLSVLFIIIQFVLFIGCSGSSDAEITTKSDESSNLKNQPLVNKPDANVDSLKKTSIALKEELEKSQQSNSNLNIRLSEAQKEINDLKAKMSEKSSNESLLEEYSLALNLFNTKSYNSSLEKFQKLYTDDPTGDRAPNCLYWVGESYFGLKNYKQAVVSFEQVLSAYPNSSKSDDALIMIGMSYLKLKDKKNAIEAFDKLQQMFPESPYMEKIPKEFKIKAKEG